MKLYLSKNLVKTITMTSEDDAIREEEREKAEAEKAELLQKADEKAKAEKAELLREKAKLLEKIKQLEEFRIKS